MSYDNGFDCNFVTAARVVFLYTAVIRRNTYYLQIFPPDESEGYKMNAFIDPPKRILFFLRFGIWISRKVTKKEMLAVKYARMISAAPLDFPAEFIKEMKEEFTNRDIVILASTSAQVNYWARLCSALGVPPAGFTEECTIGHMEP